MEILLTILWTSVIIVGIFWAFSMKDAPTESRKRATERPYESFERVSRQFNIVAEQKMKLENENKRLKEENKKLVDTIIHFRQKQND